MYYGFEQRDLPKILSFYSVTRNTIWEIADKSNILIIINDGECQISCNGESHTARRGDVFFIPANYPYSRKPVGNSLCTMTYIHFELSDAPKEYAADTLHHVLSLAKKQLNDNILKSEHCIQSYNTVYLQIKNSLQKFDMVNSILTEMYSNISNPTISSGRTACILLSLILSHISEETINLCLSDISLTNIRRIPRKLKNAISYILINYTSPIRLDELADYCKISKQQLIRHFKSEFNTTPIQYITNYKISHAKELLFNHPELSVGEISKELGFENQHYFSRVFLKLTGETPSNYRYRTLNYSKKNKNCSEQKN